MIVDYSLLQVTSGYYSYYMLLEATTGYCPSSFYNQLPRVLLLKYLVNHLYFVEGVSVCGWRDGGEERPG